MIRSVHLEDAEAIATIYNYYIENTTATFEEEAIDSEEMKKRISGIVSKYPYLVFEEEGAILGYAYGSDWKGRSAYKFTVESSIYLGPNAISKGIGSILYTALLKQLIALDFHAIIGGISLPNEASVALHEKFGFEKIALFKEVGFKFNKWVDVGYWQLITKKDGSTITL